ncbi:MAG: peptidylprolyl isomerase [Tannerella sp.]|jgi:peptidyl-prolyl cis-trans isomerase SurA|nr:peptidylprolyl isomerase [Tannerella sp.]
MKKILMFIFTGAFFIGANAKEKPEPIIMKVAGTDVPLSEFIFMAQKDAGVDLKNKKSIADYLELFKNYKLKVADAEALKIQETDQFKREYNQYAKQLQTSFLSDKEGEDSAMHVLFERSKLLPGFQYILVRTPSYDHLPADTVEPYKTAMAIYKRLENGEMFETLGEEIKNLNKEDSVIYGKTDFIYPMLLPKVVEDRIYALQPKEISSVFREKAGFYIIKLDKITPNPGQIHVAHILISLSENPSEEAVDAARQKADSLYQRLLAGADFAETAKTCSDDTISAKKGGELNYFGLGAMVEPFEQASFALQNSGDISKPVQTRYGFHIIKLIDKQTDIKFEEVASYIYQKMSESERSFDLHRSFDEKLKARYGYFLHQEAYDELEALANLFFPADTGFYYKGLDMFKPLVRIDTISFPQYAFVDYVFKRPSSAKPLSTDYLAEHFILFVRNITTEMERNQLEINYPEYKNLVKEYYDGILLFEITNKRVWSHPSERQADLESEWLKEINEKYPVIINKKTVKNIPKYIKQQSKK